MDYPKILRRTEGIRGLLVYERSQVGIDVLLSDYFKGEKIGVRSALFEHEVIYQVTDTQRGLSFRILIDQEIDNACPEIVEVFFQHIVSYNANIVLALFFQEGRGNCSSFRSTDEHTFQGGICQERFQTVAKGWILHIQGKVHN